MLRQTLLFAPRRPQCRRPSSSDAALAQKWAEECAGRYRRRYIVGPEEQARRHAAMSLEELSAAIAACGVDHRASGGPMDRRLDAMQVLSYAEYQQGLLRCQHGWSSVLSLVYRVALGPDPELPLLSRDQADARPLLEMVGRLSDAGETLRATSMVCTANSKFCYSHQQAGKSRAGASFEYDIEHLLRKEGIDFGAQVTDRSMSTSRMDFVVFGPRSVPGPALPAACHRAYERFRACPMVPVCMTTTMNDTGDKLCAQAGNKPFFALVLQGGGNHPSRKSCGGLAPLSPALVSKVVGRGGMLVCYGAMKDAIVAAAAAQPDPPDVTAIMTYDEWVLYLHLCGLDDLFAADDPRSAATARLWMVGGKSFKGRLTGRAGPC